MSVSPAHDSNMVLSLVRQVAMATPNSLSLVIEMAGGKSTYLHTMDDVITGHVTHSGRQQSLLTLWQCS